MEEDALRGMGERLRKRMPELIERLFDLLGDEETKPSTALSIIKELLAVIEQQDGQTPQRMEIIVRVEDAQAPA